MRLADRCRELMANPAFGDVQDDALDALGKGYAAIEIDWQTSAKEWQPRAYHWRDPRYFIYPPHNPYELRLIDESDGVNGKALPAYKFIIHRPRLKSVIPPARRSRPSGGHHLYVQGLHHQGLAGLLRGVRACRCG